MLLPACARPAAAALIKHPETRAEHCDGMCDMIIILSPHGGGHSLAPMTSSINVTPRWARVRARAPLHLTDRPQRDAHCATVNGRLSAALPCVPPPLAAGRMRQPAVFIWRRISLFDDGGYEMRPFRVEYHVRDGGTLLSPSEHTLTRRRRTGTIAFACRRGGRLRRVSSLASACYAITRICILFK